MFNDDCINIVSDYLNCLASWTSSSNYADYDAEAQLTYDNLETIIQKLVDDSPLTHEDLDFLRELKEDCISAKVNGVLECILEEGIA